MPSVEQHFDGKAANVRRIYTRILRLSRQFGEVSEDPKKTSIHLNRKSAFAGIRTLRSALVLTIKSTERIVDQRVEKSEQASARRWYNYVRLHDPAQVDPDIMQWLARSYELSG